MKLVAAWGIAVALTASAAFLRAEDDKVESGIPVGEQVGAFQVVKCGGADDGVEVGKQLCYR